MVKRIKNTVATEPFACYTNLNPNPNPNPNRNPNQRPVDEATQVGRAGDALTLTRTRTLILNLILNLNL